LALAEFVIIKRRSWEMILTDNEYRNALAKKDIIKNRNLYYWLLGPLFVRDSTNRYYILRNKELKKTGLKRGCERNVLNKYLQSV